MALIQFDAPTLASDIPLSALDAVNGMALNARTIDGLSYRGRRAFTNTSIKYVWEYGAQPLIIGLGCIQYRTGVTNLNLVIDAPQPGGGTHDLEVYLDGVLQYTTTLNVARTTYSFAINALGYSDLDIIEVEVRDNWSAGSISQAALIDVYMDAMSGGFASFPGVPTFGDISLANLTDLAEAQQWVMDRLSRTDQMLFMGPLFMSGLGYTTSDAAVIFDGGIAKSNGADRLRINMNYQIIANQSETVTVRLDGASVATATYTLGQSGEQGWDIDISAYTAEAPIRLTLEQTVNTAPGAGYPLLGSFYSLIDIYTARSTYPVPTLPTPYAPLDSLTFANLKTALNQICTVTLDAANRTGSATDIFNRQRMFRWRPAADAGQRDYFQNVLVARGRRAHDALWVRGKGLKIGYGALRITKAAPGQAYEWETQFTQDLITGDDVETKLLYFDSFPGLDVGMPYLLIGSDLRYAAEQVK